jgi:hypothetical protein
MKAAIIDLTQVLREMLDEYREQRNFYCDIPDCYDQCVHHLHTQKGIIRRCAKHKGMDVIAVPHLPS